MPIIITHGYGSEGGLALFEVLTISPGNNYIELQFSNNVAPLMLSAAIKDSWTFTSGTGTAIWSTSINIINADTIRIGITRATDGATYQLSMPINGLKSIVGDPYDGASPLSFVAVADPFTVLSAFSLDSQTVHVHFSDKAARSEALDFKNYSFDPPLQILAVGDQTPAIYLLTTSVQTVGVTYTLTASGIHDLYQNLIVP